MKKILLLVFAVYMVGCANFMPHQKTKQLAINLQKPRTISIAVSIYNPKNLTDTDIPQWTRHVVEIANKKLHTMLSDNKYRLNIVVTSIRFVKGLLPTRVRTMKNQPIFGESVLEIFERDLRKEADISVIVVHDEMVSLEKNYFKYITGVTHACTERLTLAQQVLPNDTETGANILLHEIGHIMGIAHSDTLWSWIFPDVMSPIPGSHENGKLTRCFHKMAERLETLESLCPYLCKEQEPTQKRP